MKITIERRVGATEYPDAIQLTATCEIKGKQYITAIVFDDHEKIGEVYDRFKISAEKSYERIIKRIKQ